MNSLGQPPIGSCEELRASILRMQRYQEADAVQISRRQMTARYLDSVAGGHPAAWDREIEDLKEQMRARNILIFQTRNELARCVPAVSAGLRLQSVPLIWGFLPSFQSPYGIWLETARRAAAIPRRQIRMPVPGGGMTVPGS